MGCKKEKRYRRESIKILQLSQPHIIKVDDVIGNEMLKESDDQQGHSQSCRSFKNTDSGPWILSGSPRWFRDFRISHHVFRKAMEESRRF